MTTSQPPLKLLRPDRAQGILLVQTHIDAFVEDSHPVRAVWAFVEGLDISPLIGLVHSQEGDGGRPAVDPRLLLALWMFATVDAVDSGRKLARLCRESLPYRWLCGGVPVEYHTLNDFRSKHAAELRTILTTSVTALISEGLVHPEIVALDGIRVRASAGSGSFRSGRRLKELLAEVEQRIAELMERWQADGTDPKGPKPARKLRELEERKSRIERAQKKAAELDEVRKATLGSDKKFKKMNKQKRATMKATVERGSRASTTDPDADVLHMADNGHRPAYNIYTSTDATDGFVLDVHVTANMTDNAEIPPTVKRLRETYGEDVAKAVLADSGFRSEEVLQEMEALGVKVYTPVPRPRKSDTPSAPRPRNSEVLEQWRERMTSEEGARLYQRRGQVVEFAFANFRNRGLKQFRVRGKEPCGGAMLLHSLTHNMMLANALSRRSKMAA